MYQLIKKKLVLKTAEDFEKAQMLLFPIQDFVNEKIKNNMYDDWNEFEHTKKNLQDLEEAVLNNSGDTVCVYYLKDGDKVVGFNFVLAGNCAIKQFVQENHFSTEEKACQLRSLHIIKEYRGAGIRWLENIFVDLARQGIDTVYLTSSHNRMFPFYDRLGERVGTYVGISDHKLYQRLGYIFKIKNIRNILRGK